MWVLCLDRTCILLRFFFGVFVDTCQRVQLFGWSKCCAVIGGDMLNWNKIGEILSERCARGGGRKSKKREDCWEID